MVYLTGDTHGDIQRFKQGKLRWLGKKDTVVVLGDFGFVWDGSAAERKRLDRLRKRPYTVLFLDGSHENYDLLAQYPETELFGGRVQSLGGNVYHVCRGSMLELEGKTYLCFGGAESQDKDDREPGVNWWKQEMPSDEEYDTCRRNLEKVDYKGRLCADPRCTKQIFDFTALALGESNRLHLFLDEILLKLTYEKWFFRLLPQGCAAFHQEPVCSVMSSLWASDAPGCSTDRREYAGHNKTCHPGRRGAHQRHSGGLYLAGKARGADFAGAGRAAGQSPLRGRRCWKQKLTAARWCLT